MAPETAKLFTKDFICWLAARFASNMGRRMVSVAVAWQIYQLTRSPLALGFIGMAEAFPFLATSLWAGHLVDRHHKKPFMVGAEAALTLCAAALCALTFLHRAPILMYYLIVALIGASVSFASVASSVFVQTTVPKEIYSRAAAWNLSSYMAATIAGPIAGGWLLTHASGRATLALAAAFFLIALTFMAGLRFLPPLAPAPAESAFQRIKEGIKFVRTQPLILACMCIDMVAVFFGDAVALFPIFADRLGGGAFGFGLLRASPAVGAALVSLTHSFRPFISPTWGLLKKAVLVFGLCMIAFALSPHILIAAVFLMLSGAADGISVIIRQSVYQAHTPDALRGRVAALSGIFISTSNELGDFESGITASLMGPVLSVIFGASLTVISVGVMARKFRHVPDK